MLQQISAFTLITMPTGPITIPQQLSFSNMMFGLKLFRMENLLFWEGKRGSTGTRRSGQTPWGVSVSAFLCLLCRLGWQGLLLLATTVIVKTLFMVIVPAFGIQIIQCIVSTEVYPVHGGGRSRYLD